ncbi:hypothetical protein [Parapedobacter luteus]|nr:hypothetical protein [Parapedobacter luteus]
MDNERNHVMDVIPYFFCLQAKRMHRTISDWGIYPLFVYISLPILFVAASVALFQRTLHAPWIYVGVAGVVLLQWCDVARQRFLQQLFGRQAYFCLRFLENTVTILPFAFFLFYEGAVWFAWGALVLAVLAVFVRTGNSGPRVLRTPFSREPFEFAIGFRASIFWVLLVYLLLVIAIYVNNENLSAATIVLMVLICASYYGRSEPLFYAWIYPLGPHAFLKLKIKTALKQVSLLVFPMAVATMIYFSDNWLAILLVLVVGCGYLVLAVLAKYAAFPGSVNLPQGMVMALSLVLPPLLLVTIPYFYRRAENNILRIL